MKKKGIISRKSVLRTVLFFVLYLITSQSFGQDYYKELETKLTELSKTVPALNEKVNVSVGEASIQEFLRAVANNTKLNINIDPEMNFVVTNNFSDVKVIDMLIFMSKEFKLDIAIIGNIISVSEQEVPIEVKPENPPKKLDIVYDVMKNNLSISVNNDTLSLIAKEITKKSNKNVVLVSGIGNQLVSAFIQDMPFDNVIEKFAYANNLQVEKTNDGFYLITKAEEKSTSGNTKNSETNKNNSSSKGNKGVESQNLIVDASSMDSISINASNTPIIDIIKDVSDKLCINYFLMSEIDGNASFNLRGISYDELLDYLFNGTDYTYKRQKDIYLLGERKMQELLSFSILQLQYRTVDKISEVIPAEIKKDIEIKEFPDLNSLLLTGPNSRINDVELFIREIDKVVPVVLIEVMIVDVTKTNNLSMGIQAGLGTPPTETSGSLFPSLDMQLTSGTINDLLNSFEGFGSLNLGRVTPRFYASIKALEENGTLKLRSTPKLSTLNGHEATLSIGKTEYYLEEKNNLIGTQNPQSVTTRTYQSVNADLMITITPFVSGDEQITLDIQVKQSDFTARMAPDAPPGQVTRDFKSLIRIKNQEMILLGGLEEKSTSDAGSGVPYLSRIPVIKWLFSSRTQAKQNSKLNIFIKPTVIY